MFQAALGAELDVEIIARSTWNAGYTLVAEKFLTDVSFFAATPPIFLRRRAVSATTLQSKTQLISVGNLPRCSKAGPAQLYSQVTKSSGKRSQRAIRSTRGVSPIQSGCTSRPRNWRMIPRRARQRGK